MDDKGKNRLGGKISKYIMENYSVFQIDSKKDLNFISMLLLASIRRPTFLVSKESNLFL